MFVSAQTLVAPRPPVNWAELKVVKMHFLSPYFGLWGNRCLGYSSTNQQPKQSLIFDQCRSVCHAEFAGKNHSTPLMASATQVRLFFIRSSDMGWEKSYVFAATFSRCQDNIF